MSPATEIFIVVQRELRKNLRSAKGIVLAVLSLLGGTSIALLMVKYQEFKRHELGELSSDQIRDLRQKALEKAYDVDQAKLLADAPEVLLMLFFMTIWLTPLLVALMGFDSIAPDIQHRSVRFWSIRTRRASFFIGKWAGLWATVSIVTFALDLFVWMVTIIRGDAPAASTLAWGMRFWLISLPMSAVWCGIAVLISSLFRSPIVALLTTFGAFFVLWVAFLIGAVAHWDPLIYVYPNHYDYFLLNPRIDRVGIGLLACLGMTGLYVIAGSTLFARRDV